MLHLHLIHALSLAAGSELPEIVHLPKFGSKMQVRWDVTQCQWLSMVVDDWQITEKIRDNK